MEKVIYIKASFAPVGKEVTVKVPTCETKKGLFGGEKEIMRKEKQWKATGFSDSKIDGEKLANDLQAAIQELNDDGYNIKSITPVISGEYDYKYQAKGISSSPRLIGNTEAVSGGASYGYGYGYSYTECFIIVASKNT